VITCEASSRMGAMSGLERVLGDSAIVESARSRVWDKRLYKHKALAGEI
jgi:hypothetical protein